MIKNQGRLVVLTPAKTIRGTLLRCTLTLTMIYPRHTSHHVRTQSVVLLFGLSFNFHYFLLSLPFNLLNLAFELFSFVIRYFTYFFTNLSLDSFTSSFYFVIAQVCLIIFVVNKAHMPRKTEAFSRRQLSN